MSTYYLRYLRDLIRSPQQNNPNPSASSTPGYFDFEHNRVRVTRLLDHVTSISRVPKTLKVPRELVLGLPRITGERSCKYSKHLEAWFGDSPVNILLRQSRTDISLVLRNTY